MLVFEVDAENMALGCMERAEVRCVSKESILCRIQSKIYASLKVTRQLLQGPFSTVLSDCSVPAQINYVTGKNQCVEYRRYSVFK